VLTITIAVPEQDNAPKAIKNLFANGLDVD
jgi:hypothetical protein